MKATLHDRIIASTVASIIAVALAAPATAQSTSPATPAAAADAPADTGLQEIIVTARRTNEKLQSTPVAVTALTSQSLLEKQVSQVTDLARATPSLSIGTGGTGPASIVYLAIRGQAQNSPNSFSDPAVGIYIDGVYVARAIVGNLGFLDPASAEILRGPQGTLFGRNTTGGALNLTTAQPVDHLEGYVKAGYGNYNSRVLEGVLNVPLAPELAARFAGRYNAHDGYFSNPFFGHKQGDVAGEYYGRGTVKWTPSNLPITWTISGDYTHYRDHGNPVAVAAINPASPLAAFYAASKGVQSGTLSPTAPGPFGLPNGLFTNFAFGPSGPISQYLNSEFATPAQKAALLSKSWKTTYGAPRTGDSEIDNLFNSNEAGSGTSNLVVDLGDVTVKSITGYRKSVTADSLDLTGTPTGGGAFVSEYKQHQFSEELQLSGMTDHLQYIGGLYYFREAGNERSDSEIFYNTPIVTKARNFGDFKSTSKGIFAQVNYNFTNALRATGGIRYTWDERFINRHAIANFTVADPVCTVGPNAGKAASVAPCNDPNTAKFKYPAWTAGIDYKINQDVFVYAKTSGASLSGGFNSRPVPAPYSQSFKPEKVRDAEAGFKGEFLDRHLRTNVAVFYSRQSNVQRIINTTFVDSAGKTQLTQFVSNAGKTENYGLEFEGTVIPWHGLELSGNFAYLHARYKKGSRNETQLVGGLPVIVDRSAEPITQAPKWTANLSATQSFELDAGKLSLHLDYSYISSRNFDFFTTGDPAAKAAVAAANQASIIKHYGLLNAQASFALHNGFEVAAWAKNLTNQPWYTNVFNSYTGLGTTEQFQGAPRTFGGTVTYRF
ncbi:MAG: hypothetical protein JWR77_752 [Rhizorhabdus sp.]|nr:hypothetical protein [Rhizorhabdus sp.]